MKKGMMHIIYYDGASNSNYNYPARKTKRGKISK